MPPSNPEPKNREPLGYRLKQMINGMLRPLDLELSRLHPADPFWVQAHLTKTERPVVFDVGAHVGNITELYLKLLPSCTVHVFEPFPESFQALERRFSGNTSVKLNQTAVSDFEGLADFHANVSSKTNSMLKTDPRVSEFWPGPFHDTTATIKVPTTTIDAYCKANSVGVIDILKFDVQGAEIQALRGARIMLEQRAVKLVYMEVIFVPTYVGQPVFEEYLQFFRSVGYVMLDMFNPARRNLRLNQSDIIFVPAPK